MLPGVVVPVASATAAIELGARVLERDGPGQARLAVDAMEIDGELRRELDACAGLGRQLIVRSSTALDDDPRWSGAFSSVGEVFPEEVAGAVTGCWSSVFRPDALGRFELMGVDVREVGMAVLIQRQLDPQAGGWAHASPDGLVDIGGTAGRPGPLLAGMVAGRRGSVRADGTIGGDLGALPLDGEGLRELARVCERARRELSLDRLEWGVDDGHVWLFQLGHSPAVATTSLDPVATAVPGTIDGRTYRGAAASPGRATGGAVRCLPQQVDTPPSAKGAILVLDDPLPVFAPLLWEVAGLVALRGNPAAHLCEVARSLHVPAVVGLETAERPLDVDWEKGGLILTLDGDSGEVCIARP